MRGRCIGKRAAELAYDAPEDAIQELAREQHRWVVDAVRAGFVDDVLSQEAVEELMVQFLGSQRGSGDEVILRFRVLSAGYVAASAQVAASWKMESASGVIGPTLTNDAGVAEMRLDLADGAVELEVNARMGGRETMRRFLVKSAR